MNKFNITIATSLLVALTACNDSSDETKANPMFGEASYTVSFNSTWSATTHPDNFPASPHYSGLIGATHNMNVNIWQTGELASAGIEQVAETGAKTILSTEINQQKTIGDVNQLISEGGINPSPGEISFSVTMQPDFTFISLVSMIAPSPDWIVGVNALDLAPNGVWLDSKTVDLYVYDAGTDDGASYTSADVDANPKQPISRIESSPFLSNNTVNAIGTLTFTKQ